MLETLRVKHGLDKTFTIEINREPDYQVSLVNADLSVEIKPHLASQSKIILDKAGGGITVTEETAGNLKASMLVKSSDLTPEAPDTAKYYFWVYQLTVSPIGATPIRKGQNRFTIEPSL